MRHRFRRCIAAAAAAAVMGGGGGGGGGGSLFLEEAAAGTPLWAVGVRKLHPDATRALRIRRSSDNAEQDIGFDGEDLDVAAISAFATANDADVVTLYEQASDTAWFTQGTASLQPRIYSAGVLEQDSNGLPWIRFYGNGAGDETLAVTGLSAHTIEGEQDWFTWKKLTSSNLWTMFTGSSIYGRFYRGVNDDAFTFQYNNVVNITDATMATDAELITGIQWPLTGGYLQWAANGDSLNTAGSTLTITNTYNSASLGAYNTSTEMNMYFREWVRFTSGTGPTAGSAGWNSLRDNINAYYSVY